MQFAVKSAAVLFALTTATVALVPATGMLIG